MTAVETDLVTLTIDGQEISVPKGTLIIRAAEQMGVQIPRFCDHPLLSPAGACRQCLVEVTDMGNGRGMPKPAASCTTTVMPGMVVKTQLTSAVADKAQQGIMEMLLINHPLDCPVCDKGGECPLQNQAMSNGRAESRFHDIKRTFAKPIAVSSNVLLDRERCVLCQRCTRFSEEIAGDPFIDMLERGPQQQVGTASDTPFHSYFSGNTVQICPVGALTSASYRFRSRPFDLLSTDTTCEHCASGCSLRADWRRGKVTRRLAGNDPDVNEEWNCDKGRWAFHNGVQADRLLTPMIRNADGVLVAASWPDALERAAEGLREARDGNGVGILPGGRLTEEDAYAYSKFARVALGTNDIDYRSRPSSDEELAFLGANVAGVTPAHVAYADVESAPAVLLVAFEPEEESPIVFLRLRKGTLAGRTKVWSIAALASDGLSKLDGTLVPAAPGVEASVLAALDASVVEALSTAGALILVGERAALSPGTLSAVVALAQSSGARLAWIPRRAGELGAIDSGALPTLLPGGRPVSDDGARVEIERIWGASVPSVAGRNAEQILAAAREGKLGALVIGGVDPGDFADPIGALNALSNCGFVVSLEIRASAVTDRADVVFPVAPPAEKAGRFVDWEGRRRPFDLTLTNAGAMSDAKVLDSLADELDAALGVATVAAIRAELSRVTGGSVRVEAPSVAPRPPVAAPLAPAAPGAGQVLLATWAELLDEGRLSDGDENLAGTAKPARALLSAATAANAGITAGDKVRVSTANGSVEVPAVIAEVVDGVVWLPTNARGCAVRSSLGVTAGARVAISRGGSS